ncbi:MAG: NifX-associated nitrogen fixation protein [Rhodospirillales bacterium]|nr:MAG: NifX-associated nitrogen fixation protein [Rhodospirillales bacterium]
MKDAAAAVAAPSPADTAALETSFIRSLVRQIRAHDTTGMWDQKPDTALLAPFVLTREQRRQIPIIADPDAKVLWRLEQFYDAVALLISDEAGVIATPMLQLSREGYGRVVVIAGMLVVLSRQLRDVHRFGFDTLTHLAAEGEGLVAAGVAAVNRHPEVALA